MNANIPRRGGLSERGICESEVVLNMCLRNSKRATRMRTVIPPIMPPTMAPLGVECLEPGVESVPGPEPPTVDIAAIVWLVDEPGEAGGEVKFGLAFAARVANNGV
jgi:hypothetical protein